MGYVLGIDFGTTYTAAAVCEDGRSPVMVALGAEGYSIPTVLFVRDDGTFLVGDAAELRAHGADLVLEPFQDAADQAVELISGRPRKAPIVIDPIAGEIAD